MIKKEKGRYVMTISRTTVDKLGIKLYDKPSAVVAEIIANSYDADATEVTVMLPLGKWLAERKDGRVRDLGYKIAVEDNGHGMVPDDINDLYLKVGKDRRTDARQGPTSRKFGRAVMGRKGVGKLAPFGICQRIEILSAGGERTKSGFRTAHFILDYKNINKETDEPYYPEIGGKDGTYLPKTGTVVTLSAFQHRRTPDIGTFSRQLARRFGIRARNWKIKIKDGLSGDEAEVGELGIDLLEETKTDLGDRPIILEDGTILPVTGWVAYSSSPYKDEEMAGVRIYARGKIVSQTRDFGLQAGFYGEHTLRSYLVGEIHADWIDDDKYEDLIRTDRQDILWSDERGEAFKHWGQELLKELARKSSGARKEKTWQVFLEKSNLEEEAKKRFREEEIQKSAMQVGKAFGSIIGRDELEDEEHINNIKEIILSIAPHKVFVEALHKIGESAESPIELISELFSRARVGELASLGQIAEERVSTIDILTKKIDAKSPEPELQGILEKAPWLINPEWTLLSANETLDMVRDRFEEWYKKKNKKEICTSAIEGAKKGKRPDFVLISMASALQILEIKKPEHKFTNEEYERLQLYIDTLGEFLEANPEFKEDFSGGVHATLVCDDLNLDKTRKRAFELLEKEEKLTHRKWNEFLRKTRKVHEAFLKVARHMGGYSAKVKKYGRIIKV